MTTITQRQKLSKGTWVLIFAVIAAIIAVAVLAAVGYISLAFLQDWLVSVGVFGATSWVNEVIVIASSAVALGVVPTWLIYRYFIGQKVKGVPLYTPQTGATPAQSTGTSTEVSN
jgi:hypothetical protein